MDQVPEDLNTSNIDPAADSAPAGETAAAPASAPAPAAPAAAAPSVPTSLAPADIWKQRRQYKPLQWIMVALGAASLALVAYGLIRMAKGTPRPFFMSVGLALWGVVSLWAQWPVLRQWQKDTASRWRAGMFALLLLFYWGMALGFGLLAAQVVRPEIGPSLLTLGLILLGLLLALGYILELVFNWKRASAGLYLAAAFLIQVLSLALFSKFALLTAVALAAISLVFAAMAIWKGVLNVAPTYSRTILGALLLFFLPLAQFLVVEARVPTFPVAGQLNLLSDVDPSVDGLKWAPRAPGEDRETFLFTTADAAGSSLNVYHAASRAGIPIKAGNGALDGWWSPDGRKVVFWNLGLKGKGFQLWNVDLSEVLLSNEKKVDKDVFMPLTRLINPNDVWPCFHDQVWGRDSRFLVFAGPRQGASRVYKADLVRGDAIPITSGKPPKLYPAWSPVHGRVAYVSKDPIPRVMQVSEDEGRSWELFSVEKHKHLLPAWNLKQNTVIYENADSPGNLMVMRANGTEKRDWSEEALNSLVWLTAAKTRFLLRYTGGGFIWRVYTCDPEGRDTKIVFERVCSEILPPQWSPKGERLAFIVRDEKLNSIFTVGKDGSWPREFFATNSLLSSLLWSPRGVHLAFFVYHEGALTEEVWRANELGLDPVKFYESRGRLAHLNWSPDERYLAFEEALQRWPIFPTLYSVILVDLNQNLARPLLPFKLYARDPAFSPSGEALAYVTSQTRLVLSRNASVRVALLRQ